MILRLGDKGAAVSDLQRRLYAMGYNRITQNNIYDEATEAAVRQLQQRGRLVVDGIYGPKTEALLQGAECGQYLRQSDIEAAAEQLGVEVAAILAINEVESAGTGFFKPGYPKILFERHIFWRQLVAREINPHAYASKYPGIVSQKPGGYAGGQSEYVRLGAAKQIHVDAAYEATSWGAFQIMGMHWGLLGFDSVQDFVATQMQDEGAQLRTLVRFIEKNDGMHKALIAHKWADFAKRYNGPGYAANLYDVKLARAYKRYADAAQDASA